MGVHLLVVLLLVVWVVLWLVVTGMRLLRLKL
jgi:hypothetical protein